MRKLFLHIGTHKTGTTSLQTTLSAHRLFLNQHGYYYPTAGVPAGLAAQHNLAWELSQDARFQGKNGMVTDLWDEIANKPYDVIVSSEDFECAIYRNPDKVAEFVHMLGDRGFQVIIVVYLRNQVEYIRSLFLELLKHGYTEAFETFLNVGLKAGIIHWKHWVFPLDYDVFLDRLRGIHSGSIVVRSYDRMGCSVIDDFFHILNLVPIASDIDTAIRLNQQLSLAESFALFCQNRQGLPVDQAVVSDLFAREDMVDFSSRTKTRILDRFHNSNLSVCNTNGVLPFELKAGESASFDGKLARTFDDIFSAELAAMSTDHN